MRKFLRAGYSTQTHKVIILFITTQLVALTLDPCPEVLCYVDMFYLKVTIHPFAYAVKLRLEFIVLNELLNLIRHGMVPGNFTAPDDEDTTDAEFPTGPRIRSTIFSDKTPSGEKFPTTPSVHFYSIRNTREIVETQENEWEYSPPLETASKRPDSQLNTAPRSANLIPSSLDPDTSTLMGEHAAISEGDQISKDNSLSELERHYLGRLALT